jgi:hypothetical protein
VKIISNFKDYYDYVPFLGGGTGDDKIIYNRQRVLNLSNPHFEVGKNFVPVRLPRYGSSGGYSYPDRWSFEFKWCCVVGKFYLLWKKGQRPQDWTILKVGDPCFVDLELFYRSCYKGVEDLKTVQLLTEGIYSPELVNLSRKVKIPVFCILNYENVKEKYLVEIEDKTPNLGQLSFPSALTPTDLFQELSYFVGNLINETPDLNPKSVSDLDRFVQKGFDSKLSFRGSARVKS